MMKQNKARLAVLFAAAAMGAAAGCKAIATDRNDLLKAARYNVTELAVEPASESYRVRLQNNDGQEDEEIGILIEEKKDEFFNLHIETVENNLKIDAHRAPGASGYYFSMPNGDVRVKVVFTKDPGYNALLKTLAVSEGTLAPAFDPLTLSYTVKRPELSTALTLDFEAQEAHAQISRSSPQALTLDEGKNIETLTVTSSNGLASNTYTLTVEVIPTLNITGITVRSVNLPGIEYTQPPANLLFENLPYKTGTNQAIVAAEADPPAQVSSGGGNFNLNNNGAPLTRNVTVIRTVDGISNAASYTLTMKVYGGSALPGFKIPEADETRLVYDQQRARWDTVYVLNNSKTITVTSPFNGTLLLAGAGGGGGGGDTYGDYRRGGNANGADITIVNAYSFAAPAYGVVIGAGGARGGYPGNRGQPGDAGGATEFLDAGGTPLFTAAGGLGGRGSHVNGGNGGTVRNGANAGAHPAITKTAVEYGLHGLNEQSPPANIGKGGGGGYGYNDRNGRNGGSGVIIIRED